MRQIRRRRHLFNRPFLPVGVNWSSPKGPTCFNEYVMLSTANKVSHADVSLHTGPVLYLYIYARVYVNRKINIYGCHLVHVEWFHCQQCVLYKFALVTHCSLDFFYFSKRSCRCHRHNGK